MHQIDESFRKSRQERQRRRRNARIRRYSALAALLFAVPVSALVYFTYDKWSFNALDEELVPVEDEELVQVDPDRPVYIPPIVDLPGAPVIINIGAKASGRVKVRKLDPPPDVANEGVLDKINLLSDSMISSSERFMTTLPSSQEDFAFFQIQQSRVSASSSTLDDYVPPAPNGIGGVPDGDSGINDDAAAGWGETLENEQQNLPDFQKTRIEDTTSIAFVKPEEERFHETDDIFVKVLSSRTLDSIVSEHRFSADDARLAGETVKAALGIDALQPGYILAMRGLSASADQPNHKLVQLSIYTQDKYLGTLVRIGDGMQLVETDPWLRDDLFNYTVAEQTVQSDRKYRLLDAIYSTAARNNVPTAVIGETIMLLSRKEDLNVFATPEDKLVLLYAKDPRGGGGGAGRVLYASIQSEDRDIECFVYRPSGGSNYSCLTEDDQESEVTVVNGMVTPVNGVMTSTFGPRKHPILKTVRIHKGVDWAAPTGTPIYAAFDGEIAYAGDGRGYGNIVRIKHDGNRETRYAHMSRFGAKARPGTAVRAGDVIGYVGTTGLSTGPHLHFELYSNGKAIDPLMTVAVAAVGAASGAVEKLVNKIIRVESAGNPRAKNPLSSATGLGQFITSTWLRMMRTYRPDLANSLSRAQLLELRYNPTISRQMVTNLAREGEAYLKARGHRITAGRLYLCHFLGMEGAHVVLRSPPDASLISVLGAGVIKANPFLTGKNVAYVQNWAERKMQGRGYRPQPVAPTITKKTIARVSPQFAKYKEAITALIKANGQFL